MLELHSTQYNTEFKMSVRKAALNSKNQVKTDFSTYLGFSEHCDFCVLSFQTRPELKAHVLTHFKKKVCLQTQKTLLLILDDWFELHINHGCGTEKCDPDIVSTSVEISNALVKEEETVEENGSDNDEILSNVFTKIETESETELNFDGNISEYSTSASSEKKIKNYISKAKNCKSKHLKDESTSLPVTKRKKMTRITEIKAKIRNGDSLTTKPAHSKTKSIKCRICKQKFAGDALIFHLQSRHVPKIDPIPTCETCGKTFSTPGNLRSHQYLHAERGRYICSYCGKVFVRNANLKEHINLHTGARPFVCEVCKKTFHRETLLRNHRRIHTGEKKYRCNIEDCERAYMFDIDLKRHKFSAHGIYTKKHPCFICSKIFSENKLLKKHLETHEAH